MGRLKLISAILAVIMVLCGWSLYYTHKKTTSLMRLITQSVDAVQQENYESATTTVHQAVEDWNKTGNVLVLFMNNESIEQVDLQFIELEVAVQQCDKTLSLTLLQQLDCKIKHLYHDELPYLKNVF